MIARCTATFALVAALLLSTASRAAADSSLAEVIAGVQPKIVKIYGVGGLRGLEAYQSGFVISAEGHLLTVWSYVLDTDYVTVVLDDGRRFEAELVGADPRLEIAVLKIDAAGLDHFNLHEAETAQRGARVLAFSNLYGVASGDEPASVQHGHVSAVTSLQARRGVYRTPYDGPAYVIDAMTNNPGASGGALTDQRGRLLGMLGKELRSAQDNTWLNYAMPIGEISASAADILAGRTPSSAATPSRMADEPLELLQLGIVLVPDLLPRTPPFVDLVHRDSPAAAVGIEPDDLVLMVDGRLVSSCRALEQELARFEQFDPVTITVMRGEQLMEFSLQAEP